MSDMETGRRAGGNGPLFTTVVRQLYWFLVCLRGEHYQAEWVCYGLLLY